MALVFIFSLLTVLRSGSVVSSFTFFYQLNFRATQPKLQEDLYRCILEIMILGCRAHKFLNDAAAVNFLMKTVGSGNIQTSRLG